MKSIGFALVIAMLTPIFMFAEGSKDFRDYPGKRLWLDTRDSQQIKVYAAVGEFINVGASHTGISGGFITVYRPDGSVAAVFNNSGTNFGLGIINDDIEEINGPNGGGTTNGLGYRPGVIQVPNGMDGAWTVVMDFPNYAISTFDTLSNNEPWTRAVNQKLGNRVVLAWDVTVTQGAAGNEGGTPIEGRVYSNEYISILSKNGHLTSPTFYVLSQDGYQYAVNFIDADPFRFPISSNSFGLVDSDFTPIYKSKQEGDFERSDDPMSWILGGLYLYEPQAEDFGPLLNHKIFFNLPDTNMPGNVPTTDIFRNNQHQTWLYSDLQVLDLDSIYFFGATPEGFPCGTPYYELGEGGYFVTSTNIGGQVTIRLDVDDNGSFDDPIDVTLFGITEGGLDSIFWDGNDGLGNPYGIVGDTFYLGYSGKIRFGEIHIANTDVEDNFGGVTFELLNGTPAIPTDLFYYDHSDLTAIPEGVSGGGTPGNALPTNLPFTYGNAAAYIPTSNFGNNKYIDQWVFVDFEIPMSTMEFIVVDDCSCTANQTPDVVVTGDGNLQVCIDDSAVLQTTNLQPGLGDLTYSWQSPNGFFFTEVIGGTDTSVVLINPVTAANGGNYIVTASTIDGCLSDPDTINLLVNPLPSLMLAALAYETCDGEDLVISATNLTAGIGAVDYTWTGPNFTFSGTSTGDGVFSATVSAINQNQAGTYTLTVTDDNGCGTMISVEVVVNQNPVIANLLGGGAFCEGDEVTLTTNNSVAGIGNFTTTWVLPNGTILGGGTDIAPFFFNIPTLSQVDTGTYTVFITSDAGCVSNTVATQVTFADLPSVINVTPDTIVCENDELILSATNATNEELSYTWTGPNGYTATGTAAGGATFTETISPINAFGAGQYVLTISAGSCAADPITVNVETRPNPSLAPIVGGGTYCVGDSVTLFTYNTTPGIDSLYYTCIFPNANVVVQFSAGTDTIFITFPSISLDDVGILSCAAESTDSCGSSLVQAVINVQATPIISDLTADTTLCAGQNLTLTAVNNAAGTGSATYTWTGPNGFSFTETAPFAGPFPVDISNITVAGSGEYCLNITSDAGCMAMEQCTNVTVNPTPILTPTTGGGEYCEGDDVTLTTMNTVVGTGELTYTCTGPNGFMQTGTIGENEPIELILANIMANQAGIYTCVVETAEGCISNESSATVTVNATPVISDINGGGPYCEGETINLTATNQIADVGMITYTWTGPNNFEFTGTANGNGPFTASVPNAQLANAGEYCLVITSMAGCGADEMCVNVVVNPNPIVDNFTGGGEFCPDEMTTLAGTIDLNGTTSVDWTMTGPGFDQSGTSTMNETISFDITVSEATAGGYTFTLTSDQGCTASANQTITLLQIPTPMLVPITDPICPGEELQLVINPALPAGTVYEWFENGTSLGTTTTPSFIVMDAQGGAYSVTATLDGCSESSAEITVLVVPAPIAVDDIYEVAFNTLLSDDVTNNDQIGPDGVIATLDTEPEFGTVVFNADGSFTYTPNAGFAGADMFTYTICSVECSTECSSATVFLNVTDPDCDEIYNLISPNGDGDNDVFFVPCLETIGGNPPRFPTNSIKIFNRWGDVVYSAKPYNNDWAGTNEKGQDLPASTYFYMIELREGGGDGEDNLKVGYVTVVR